MTTLQLHGGDPKWVVVQRGHVFSLLDAANVVVGEIELRSVAAEVPILFCNGSVLVTQHDADATTVTALTIPSLTPSAQLQLPGRWMPKCVTGQRMALLAESGLKIAIVRVATRALAVIEFEVGAPAEFVVALDKQQILVGSGKKLEAIDALTGRPMMRVNVTLPPAPRQVGSAQGHLWIARPGSDSLLVVRLSDGRVFPHVIGAEPQHVYADLHSPYVVIATERGLVRLQCFSHTLTALGTPPADVWALQPNGNDTVLLGMSTVDTTPWRAGLGSNQAVVVAAPTSASPASSPASAPITLVRTMRPPARTSTTSWRSQLVAVDAVPGNAAAQRSAVPADSTLLQWCSAVGCSELATTAIIALYARYLRGAAPWPVSEAARWLGDQDAAWHEVLGHGEMAAHGLLDVGLGGLSLTLVACRFFDDSQPRHLLRRSPVVGPAPGPQPRQLGPGVYWCAQQSDLATTLAHLTEQFGALAVLPSPSVGAISEAYLHGMTIVIPAVDEPTPLAISNAPARAAIVVIGVLQPWFVATILPQP